jgi:hypothetical protein
VYQELEDMKKSFEILNKYTNNEYKQYCCYLAEQQEQLKFGKHPVNVVKETKDYVPYFQKPYLDKMLEALNDELNEPWYVSRTGQLRNY